jgi:hypothetical protein
MFNLIEKNIKLLNQMGGYARTNTGLKVADRAKALPHFIL